MNHLQALIDETSHNIEVNEKWIASYKSKLFGALKNNFELNTLLVAIQNREIRKKELQHQLEVHKKHMLNRYGK